MRLFLIAALICANYQLRLQAQSRSIKSIFTTAYTSLDTAGKQKGPRVSGVINRVNYNDGCYELFDREGKLVERRTFDKDSVLEWTVNLEYDEKGNLIAKKSVSSLTNKKEQWEYFYTFDQMGRVVKKECKKDGVDESYEEYSYTANGALSTCVKNNYRTVYSSTKEGKLQEASKYYKESLSEKEFYDDQERVIKTEDYTPGGEITYTSTYRFDGHSNKIEQVTSYASGVKSIWNWQYSYDENGNWIRQVQFYNGKAEKIGERRIVYY